MTTATLEKPELREGSPKAAKRRNPVRYAVLIGLLILLLLIVAPLLVVVINAVKSPAD
jgi:raffinose/stachyose/melibiose transport system permease protein